MNPRESPIHMVMGGSYGSYEPPITIWRGDSRGLMTISSISEAFLGFDLDLWLYLGASTTGIHEILVANFT